MVLLERYPLKTPAFGARFGKYKPLQKEIRKTNSKATSQYSSFQDSVNPMCVVRFLCPGW